ncbi:hypothetical protein [Pararhodonellum marinum]|uniref:hypothetical protein n=1 Tax=Pararhodonellum marinum TaxID=2755358 RepID=UPI00189060A5|nr:hypothetical protein [Pararhodonellum marinum]
MKFILPIFFLCCSFLVNGQELKGIVKNHEKAEMDLVLMIFGMDNLISIGKVDKKGQFNASLENISLDHVPEENKSVSIGELYFNFFFKCNDNKAFGDIFDKPAARQDYVRLTKDGDWSGTVFLVSDEGLRPWLEDPGYKNAIKGSFYEVMYVEEDLSVKTSCRSTDYADDNTEVETEYNFDIELKKGFNWVEYTIQEVYETDPDIRASFPSKVAVTNLKDPAKMLWVGTYY